MDELREHLQALHPILEKALTELENEKASLETRCREAELEAYSWDLSAQKGAEIRLEEQQELHETVLSFKQSVLELVSLLD